MVSENVNTDAVCPASMYIQQLKLHVEFHYRRDLAFMTSRVYFLPQRHRYLEIAYSEATYLSII